MWILGRESPREIRIFCSNAIEGALVPGSAPKGDCVTALSQKTVKFQSAVIKVRPDRGGIFFYQEKNSRGVEEKSIGIRPGGDQGVVVVSTKKGTVRGYRGRIVISVKNGALYLENLVPLEEYLKSVAGCEMVPIQFEAMKAQAVLSRTLIAGNGTESPGADTCDLTYCQAYKGIECESDLSRTSVRETRGQILVYNGEPVQTYYHSTSGGMTTTAQDVWGSEPAPYLSAVEDGEFSSASPHYRWTVTLGPRELDKLNHKAHLRIDGIRVLERDPTGRVKRLALTQGADSEEMSGFDFYRMAGQALGWNVVKSTWFDVKRTQWGFQLDGRGLGHGVGMCQWGAIGHAKAGWDYVRILEHYFPGAQLAGK